MDCANCGHANRPEARFCGACGSQLERRCRECDASLPAEIRFCDQCGTPAEPDGSSSSVPPPIEDAVRKTVTVLFCDLVGSTAFAERVDAEAARETMGQYHAVAQEVIERERGTVAKYIGDGVMAMFGVPAVGEDDALRAVLCGVELQRQVQELTAHVRARYDVELGMRVGINTGEVVIADEDADVVGDALNTAARLEAHCTPGLVLVGEETWRLTRAEIRYEPLGPVAVKGKKEPVSTFQVVDVAAADEEPTPFVGRTDELTTLREAFDQARDAMAAFAHDSLTVGDHRPASIGEVSGAAYRQLIEQLYDDHDNQLRNVVTEIHDIDGGIVVFTFDRYLPTDPLGAPTWRLRAVMEIEGGRPVRAELFAEDQLPVAQRRFNELIGDLPGTSAQE